MELIVMAIGVVYILAHVLFYVMLIGAFFWALFTFAGWIFKFLLYGLGGVFLVSLLFWFILWSIF